MIYILGDSNYEGFDVATVLEAPAEAGIDKVMEKWQRRDPAIVGTKTDKRLRWVQHFNEVLGLVGETEYDCLLDLLCRNHGAKVLPFTLCPVA